MQGSHRQTEHRNIQVKVDHVQRQRRSVLLRLLEGAPQARGQGHRHSRASRHGCFCRVVTYINWAGLGYRSRSVLIFSRSGSITSSPQWRARVIAGIESDGEGDWPRMYTESGVVFRPRRMDGRRWLELRLGNYCHWRELPFHLPVTGVGWGFSPRFYSLDLLSSSQNGPRQP